MLPKLPYTPIGMGLGASFGGGPLGPLMLLWDTFALLYNVLIRPPANFVLGRLTKAREDRLLRGSEEDALVLALRHDLSQWAYMTPSEF